MSAAAAAGEQMEPVTSKFLDRNSRVIGTMGLEAMLKMTAMRILLCGTGAGGIEIAKNLALAGVRLITIHDPRPPKLRDLGHNFTIEEGTDLASGSAAKLSAPFIAELNPTTRVQVCDELNDDVILGHDCVIITSACPGLGFHYDRLVQINELARSRKAADGTPKPVSFIYVMNGGPLGSIFVDHGDEFTTTDPDGRPPAQKSILEMEDKVDNVGRAYTRIRFETPEGMTPGSLRDRTQLTFSEVKGLTKVDGDKTISINDIKVPFFAICGMNDAASTVRIYPALAEQGFSPYLGGGFIHEPKEVVKRTFRSFKDVINTPHYPIITDSAMDGNMEKFVHLALATFLSFNKTPHREDAEEALTRAKALLERNAAAVAASASADAAPAAEKEIPAEEKEWPQPPPSMPPAGPLTIDYYDEDMFKCCASLAHVTFQPLSCVLGAIAAQEVVKISGKYTPIHQILHLNMTGVLDDSRAAVTGEALAEFTPQGTRYDDLVEMFGSKFVHRLHNLKMFMVGCGALGCEDIKNFALCGITCGPEGKLTVTDNDTIEVSNLSRQFLFREENVTHSKSLTAAARVLKMNKDMKIVPLKTFVGPKTEGIFDDAFWDSLDVVCNALDNIEARIYVDRKCVLHEKVLIEAGTMGTGGNVDIIVPHKTTSYEDGGAADQTGGVPMCTLRNFPYIFDHVIEWGRSQFEDMFVAPISLTQQLRDSPAHFVEKLKADYQGKNTLGEKRSFLAKQAKQLAMLGKVVDLLRTEPTMNDCVLLAWQAFHAQFRDRILSLVTALPIDSRNKKGELFWSGHKKFPVVLDASPASRETFKDIDEFLITSANLYACMLGLHPAKHAARYNDPDKRWMEQYRTRAFINTMLAGVEAPSVVLSKVDDLDEDSAAASAAGEELSDEAEEARFYATLDQLAAKATGIVAKPVLLDFEKDDDDNFHIDFIAAAANLRALNYQIPTADRMKVKLVAGRIIPAIATTTAAVTGFALMEYFKVLLGKGPSALRNGNIDIGSVNYVLFDRDPPRKIKSRVEKTYIVEKDYTEEHTYVAWPNPHTKYDKIIVDVTDATTLEEFVDKLQAMSEGAPSGPYEVTSIACNKGLLWNGLPSHKALKTPILSLIVQFAEPEADPAAFWAKRRIFPGLEVLLDTADGDEVDPAVIIVRRV